MKVSENLKKINVLYVEDDEIVREIFSYMLKKYVKKLYIAPNGLEGLELFKNNSIDIVISDIQMPKMNGLEMAKEIRKLNADIPIVFTTAFGDSSYLKEAIEIGVEAYILKPIEKEDIFNKLNKIANSIFAKKELENYMKLMKIVFNYQKDGLALLDSEFNIVLFNRTIEVISEEIINKHKNFFEFVKEFNSQTDKVISKKDFEDMKVVKTFICKSKENKFYELEVQKVDDYFLVSCKDITEFKLKVEEIENQSMKDELTNAYNRKKIDELLQNMKNEKICLIMCDIDNFKQLNDTYGHLKGDEVLKKLSQAVMENIRDEDIFIRWGGEEFIILLKNTKKEIAEKITEKLRVIVNSIKIEEVGYFSCSFGVACGIVNGEKDFETILKKADDALYLAKKNGKNRVEVYWD